MLTRSIVIQEKCSSGVSPVAILKSSKIKDQEDAMTLETLLYLQEATT